MSHRYAYQDRALSSGLQALFPSPPSLLSPLPPIDWHSAPERSQTPRAAPVSPSRGASAAARDSEAVSCTRAQRALAEQSPASPVERVAVRGLASLVPCWTGHQYASPGWLCVRMCVYVLCMCVCVYMF